MLQFNILCNIFYYSRRNFRNAKLFILYFAIDSFSVITAYRNKKINPCYFSVTVGTFSDLKIFRANSKEFNLEIYYFINASTGNTFSKIIFSV